MPHRLEYKRAIQEMKQKRIVSKELYKCQNCGEAKEHPSDFENIKCTDTTNWVLLNG